MLGYRVRAARGAGPRPAAAGAGGYSVPVGQDVMISVYNIHRSPAVWADPHAFRPERFPLDQPVPTEQNTDYRRAPAARGVRRAAGRPRSCPGGGLGRRALRRGPTMGCAAASCSLEANWLESPDDKL